MQFLILAQDRTDSQAPERRARVRAAHIETLNRYHASGNMIAGAALLDERSQQMNGSAIMVDFPSRAALDAWLAEEPYITGKVWGEIKIIPCQLGVTFQHLLPR